MSDRVLVTKSFIARQKRSRGNDTTDGVSYFYRGNEIARWFSDSCIGFTLSGWPTVTTRDRLNRIKRTLHLSCGGFTQLDFAQYGPQGLIGDYEEWVYVDTTNSYVSKELPSNVAI